jgi:hypothetical protein
MVRPMRWVVGVLLLMGGVLSIRSVPLVLREYGALAPPVPATDDAAALIAAHGRPDEDQVSQSSPETSRSRVLRYRGLQVVFNERAIRGVRVWKLVGFLDANTKTALSGEEALERLAR